ncbi:MAG: Nif11-like leader peptide family natural product precursor [Synechococcaceae bacterium WB9_2_112]|jgi:predicted ribosomally synthesized peptide with nif11-like leader|nr:Nif11-like leader peptide family natural product precursor [Synechococcaceae bacterium WB9_2_112]
MSRQQLHALVAAIEAQPSLRRHLRACSSWEQWLEQVNALGYGITRLDLLRAQREERVAQFLMGSTLEPIRSLR